MKKLSVLLVLAACESACEGGSGSVGDGDAGSSSGSNGNVQIDMSQFAHDCKAKSDCVAVRSGNVCAACGCESATIAKKDYELYVDRFRDLRLTCPPRENVVCAGDCASPRFACVSGTCTWGVDEPPADAGTD